MNRTMLGPNLRAVARGGSRQRRSAYRQRSQTSLTETGTVLAIVDVTAGKVVDIPVVVQLGKWRKQLTVNTTACTNVSVPAYGAAPANKTAALPTTKAEGDIPLTAISTGYVDGLECVLRKMGVADLQPQRLLKAEPRIHAGHNHEPTRRLRL